MNYILDIAKRYLIGKKSTNAINLITGISVFGISIGAAALILVLSVFNGLETLITSYLNSFNPDLIVLPSEGKYFDLDSTQIYALQSIGQINEVSASLEEVALFEYKGSQEVGVIKGVDQRFERVTKINQTIREGNFDLFTNETSTAIFGIGMSRKLGINLDDPLTPVTIYMPKRKKTFQAEKDFRTKEAYPIGEFSVQTENDYQYVISKLDFVQNLLQLKNKLSAFEISLTAGADERLVIREIEDLLGNGFEIKNRYQQDEAFLKIMNIERWVSYLIVSLTLFLVAFNLAGSLWMIVLDKKKDISILKAMGMNANRIKKLFLLEGLLISGSGLVLGILLAVVLYFLQSNLGIVPIPDGFAIDAYPIELRLQDFFVVAFTVLIVGILASLLPANRAAGIKAFIREE